MKKGEPLIVISNHQTDLDPFFLYPSFNLPVYPVATDTLFSGRFAGRFFEFLGVIPKKKAAADLKAVLRMKKVLKEKGSIMLFLEGNRYYAEFQYYIDPFISKFIKSTGATLLIYNLHGGNGVSPRFKRKNRKGKFYGEIKRVIKPEEYNAYSDEEFIDIIKENIRVFDCESGLKYKSPVRGEYLERMFFVCPKCGAFETLRSEKEHIKCLKCGYTAEFTEDLKLRCIDPEVDFTRLIDWWNFQKTAVVNMNTKGLDVIFSDDNVKLFRQEMYEKRKLLAKGKLYISEDKLCCKDVSLDIRNIESASAISGRKVSFTHDGSSYCIRGGKRFNPLKYVFMFNLLDTRMREKKTDKYFNPEVLDGRLEI